MLCLFESATTGSAKCRQVKYSGGIVDNFRIEQVARAMTQRAFIDLCSGFEFPLHHAEREAALLTVD